MFGRISTMKSTGNYSDEIKNLRKAIEEADAIVIGAGAGLSTSAGFVYNGERFEKHFSEFGRKYGFKDMYSGGFYPYDTPEEMWAYWSKFIFVNRFLDAPKPVYERLLSLVKDKIILSSPQTWIIASKRLVLIRRNCFIPRVIMACFNAVSLVLMKLMRMKR